MFFSFFLTKKLLRNRSIVILLNQLFKVVLLVGEQAIGYAHFSYMGVKSPIGILLSIFVACKCGKASFVMYCNTVKAR